jgi:glycosyltransferase involved in cell wall biosynthesis
MTAHSPAHSEIEEGLVEITPFILTYNEEPNIGRCLDQLAWATRIIVVDSGSTDRTLSLVAQHPQARVVHRPFDSHTGQSNFALSLIDSSLVLSLDADYILTPGFKRMLREGEWRPGCAYFAPFRVCVRGRPLRASLYPPRAVLFARKNARYEQDGHTQRLIVAERTQVLLPEAILHDDRKSRARWRENQRKYAELEAGKLRSVLHGRLGLADRIRALGWPAPLIIFPYVLFIRGLVLDGWLGILYAWDRAYVELLLCLIVLKKEAK